MGGGERILRVNIVVVVGGCLLLLGFFLRALLVALDDGCGRTERWLLSQWFSVAFTALHNAVLTRKGRRRRVVSSSV